MSVPQYLRKCRLVVGDDHEGIDLSALRIAFSVRRGDIQTPNTLDVRVYNVSDQTAARILQRAPSPEFTRIVLEAGYEGNFGLVFSGSIKQVRHGRETQTDTYLDITAADGDSAYNFSVTALSIAAGATPKDAALKLIQGMVINGVATGYIPTNMPGNAAPRGQVFFGMTRDRLRDVAKDTQCSWSIQDGKVDFIPLTAYKPGEIPEITSATGMVGLPQQTQNGIRLTCLLNPNIKIGQAIKINNKSIQQYHYSVSPNQEAANNASQLFNKINDDGIYYVMAANHTGDTRGNEWYSDLNCLAIDASVSLDGPKNSIVVPPTIKRYG